MSNQQPPESVAGGDGLVLDLHSIFLTVQGEGPLSGRRAVFIRLAGCNLQCPGCDTEYTQGRTPASIFDIASSVAAMADGKPCVVVITGGEPLRQPIFRLVKTLLVNWTVQIESNGTVSPENDLCNLLASRRSNLMLVVSPKTRNINARVRELATAFKYVVDHRHVDPDDGLPTVALEHADGRGVARPFPGRPVYLTPYDAGMAGDGATQLNVRNREKVAELSIKHGYIAQVQLHKLLGVA